MHTTDSRNRRPTTLANHLEHHQSIAVGIMGPIASPRGDCPEPAANSGQVVVHPHAAMAFCLAGEAVMWCGTRYRLRAGDALLVPEGAPHYAIESHGLRAVTMALCTACLTSPGGVRLARRFAEVSHGAPAIRSFQSVQADLFQALLEGLAQELSATWTARSDAIDSYLSLIAIALERATPGAQAVAIAGRSPKTGSLSGKALAFVAQNATEGISLANVAAHVHRSRAHTATVVKTQTGFTVGYWITQSQMAAARQQLLTTDDAIEHIALHVGFGSTSHFYRKFLSTHGMTPSVWRRAHRSGPAKQSGPATEAGLAKEPGLAKLREPTGMSLHAKDTP